VFISSFLQMARQRYFWSSPSRLFRIAWSIASNLHRQLEIFRILSLPAFTSQVLADPVFPFKYLSTDYLFTGLPARARAASFAHHLRFVEARLPGRLLRQRRPLEMTVFETREDGNLYTVRLDFPSQNSIWEGELRLGFRVDEVLTYCLQFTIVPGWVLQSKERHVVFISRVQGMKGHYEQIRCATKSLREVAPPALLMAALQGIADAWGIGAMAGISAQSQYCYDESAAGLFRQTYDDFFLALGATRTTKDFFSSPLPLPAKPLALIKNGHKSRTLKKRAFKLRISDEVRRWMIEHTSGAVAMVPIREIVAVGVAEEDSVAS
jgi:uncharacterized protein